MSTAIDLRGVEKSFGNTSVIRNANLTVAQGERHALIGPNGAGKSTLFNLISGYMIPTAGSILICISADSRAEVDDLVSKAENTGGAIDPSPQDDYDFMYGRSFEDLDGHLWGVNWMDFEAFAKDTAATAA